MEMSFPSINVQLEKHSVLKLCENHKNIQSLSYFTTLEVLPLPIQSTKIILIPSFLGFFEDLPTVIVQMHEYVYVLKFEILKQ